MRFPVGFLFYLNEWLIFSLAPFMFNAMFEMFEMFEMFKMFTMCLLFSSSSQSEMRHSVLYNNLSVLVSITDLVLPCLSRPTIIKQERFKVPDSRICL